MARQRQGRVETQAWPLEEFLGLLKCSDSILVFWGKLFCLEICSPRIDSFEGFTSGHRDFLSAHQTFGSLKLQLCSCLP